MRKSRLLLIAHEATRSGAPILLLTFARWLKQHEETPFDVLLLSDGPLREEFAAVAPTRVATELSGRTSLLGRARRLLLGADEAVWRERVIARLDIHRYTVVYGNSIACLPLLAAMKRKHAGLRAVCAVHELEWVLGELFGPGDVGRLLPSMDQVVAGSRAVCHNLVERHGMSPRQVEVIHSFLPADAEPKGDGAALRAELDVLASDLVVVAVGAAELRKGTDLAPPITAALVARRPDRRIRFIWLGGAEGDSFVRMCRLDAERLGVADRVTFVPGRPGANELIALADVFALPSREDPFPLVALTAISLNKPIVAFRHGGGMDELLADGAGRLVPYLDIPAFADAIVELASDPAARSAITDRARQQIAAHYDSADLAQRLRATLVPALGTSQ